jgi:hypothetical protein
VRIVAGVVVLAVLAIGGLFAFFYLFVYLPQQHDAAAFARLSGSARRLAIYDAFTTQIDRHYYDQRFSGFDWPKLRREWRSKAAAEANDIGLYDDVFFQMTQRFPASHVAVIPPSAPASRRNVATTANPAAGTNALCTMRGAGTDLFHVRRGKRLETIVGEVRPNSPAAHAGVTPGWVVESAQWSAAQGAGRFKAVFIRLSPDQMHAFENTGSLQTDWGAHGTTIPDVQAVLERLRQRIDFKYRCGAPVEPFETRRLPSGALYVRFDEFQAPILKKVEAALKTAGDRGAVLDLRFNSGGYAIKGLNLLLPEKRPVYFERAAASRRLISTDAETWRYSGPLAVLMGPESMSAAEMTAAALKHEHRAVLIGRRSNGSVLGALTFPLPDGGTVQIPVVDIELLDGQRLEDNGVTPDIEVFPTQAEVRSGIDPALQRAERELSIESAIRR